jgi:hypothetical protein
MLPQALFREVNERLEELATTFQDVAGSTTVFACECADLMCVEQIDLTVGEYEAVRSHPNQFFVLPGHVDAEVENVVRENERFVVVAKIGAGAATAEATHPRD